MSPRGDGSSWRLDGAAVFAHEDAPARLVYHVTCDIEWVTQKGRVRGWLGEDPLTLDIARTEGGAWSFNGEIVPGVDDCVDLDFGFTPATNLRPLRRLTLEAGEAADAPAAWLNLATRGLERDHGRLRPPVPRPLGGGALSRRGRSLRRASSRPGRFGTCYISPFAAASRRAATGGAPPRAWAGPHW